MVINNSLSSNISSHVNSSSVSKANNSNTQEVPIQQPISSIPSDEVSISNKARAMLESQQNASQSTRNSTNTNHSVPERQQGEAWTTETYLLTIMSDEDTNIFLNTRNEFSEKFRAYRQGNGSLEEATESFYKYFDLMAEMTKKYIPDNSNSFWDELDRKTAQEEAGNVDKPSEAQESKMNLIQPNFMHSLDLDIMKFLEQSKGKADRNSILRLLEPYKA